MWTASTCRMASDLGCSAPYASSPRRWRPCAMARASWEQAACIPSCARPSWPAKPGRAWPSPTDETLRSFRGLLRARLAPTSRRGAESQRMATSVRASISTRDKLLRAREAAVLLAQLTTTQKNDLLLAMADAIVANAAGIIEANQVDLASSDV